MDVSFNGIARLVSFIDRVEGQTYPEAPTSLHSDITREVLEALLPRCLGSDARILDVGCGQGPALDIFREKGYRNVVGITLNEEDVRVCSEKGHKVLKMDQSFLDFSDGVFDFIWARHVIEHSIFPYFTLHEFHRILAGEGLLYLEVPAPETSCRHETNPNHYSVLGFNAWGSLITRSGFTVADTINLDLSTQLGPDQYWGFICKKKESVLTS